jgi:two-component system response regulator
MDEKIILMVEDSDDDVKLTKMALKDNNISNRVVVLGDGEEALEYLFCEGKYVNRDINERPAVILLDIKLPKLSGLEVLAALRQDVRTKYLPVVILTSSTQEEDVINGYKNGCNSFVCKPVDFDDFSKAIKHLGAYWILQNRIPEGPTNWE